MDAAAADFAQLVRTVLERYARQNDLPAWSEAELTEIGTRLYCMAEERGLPPLLPPEEMGDPGEMSAEEVAPLVARLLNGIARADALATPTRQLVKACFQGEFRKCRDSYREVDATGVCRRQQLRKARERISGSHCVDCPYWLSLAPPQHEKFLAKDWIGDSAEFAAHRAVYLPEDYRRLRRAIRALAG